MDEKEDGTTEACEDKPPQKKLRKVNNLLLVCAFSVPIMAVSASEKYSGFKILCCYWLEFVWFY